MAEEGTFYEVLSRAMNDFAKFGYDSEARLEYWRIELEAAISRSLPSEREMAEMLQRSLWDVYRKLVERGGVLKRHLGVAQFQLNQIAPHLRRELDRRIMASANLIKLNRDEEVAKTLRRFSGWATSLPAGGSADPQKKEAKDNTYKALSSLPFTERRVLIDQGHKLNTAISAAVATQSGAIGARWRSHGEHDTSYNARPKHLERDTKGFVFLVRGCWAVDQGYVKPAKGVGFTDSVEQPGEWVFCRCWWDYVYSLRDIPTDMLTAKGLAKIAEMNQFRLTRS